MPNPALCTEAVNENYTIGTFYLYLQAENGIEFSVGNIQTGSFTFRPNIVEHRRGVDNSLDALFKVGSDYLINFTGDEITSRNIGTLLNEDPVNEAGGCKVPLTGSLCVRDYGARLLHTFPCSGKTLEVTFWRAAILAEFTLNFEQANVASFAGEIRALACSSIHPTEPYGKLVLLETCPAS